MKILPVNKTTFGMNFELSQETLDLISENTGLTKEELRKRSILEPLPNCVTGKQTTSKLDIPARNIYLSMGRILKLEDVKIAPFTFLILWME